MEQEEVESLWVQSRPHSLPRNISITILLTVRLKMRLFVISYTEEHGYVSLETPKVDVHFDR